MSAKKKKPPRLKKCPDTPVKDKVLRCTGCGYPIAAGQIETHNHRGQKLQQPICRTCYERPIFRTTESWDKLHDTYVEDDKGFHRRQQS